MNILDVGTGTGVMMGSLNKLGNTTGLDFSDESVKFCRRRGFNNVFKGEANNIPFESSTFDLVCAMDILEHLDEDSGAMKEFKRVLRPGGFVFITVPAYMFLWGSHDIINMHKRRYEIGQIIDLYKMSGFSILKVTYFNSILFPIVASVRLLKRILRKGEFKAKSDFFELPYSVNKILEWIFSAEAYLLKYFNFPFGVSILCIGKKKENENE